LDYVISKAEEAKAVATAENRSVVTARDNINVVNSYG